MNVKLENVRLCFQRTLQVTEEKKIAKKIGRKGFALYRNVTLFCLCMIILYPILNMLSLAFRAPADISDPTIVWIPKTFSLNNFKAAFAGLNFLSSILNTLLITVSCTALTLISCSLVGYGFARYKFRGSGLLFMLVLFTIIVPPQTVLIPRYLSFWKFDFLGVSILLEKLFGVCTQVNLLNNPITLILPAAFGMGIRSGLYIYIFRQFFRGLPKELEDSASIDGCGPLSTFFRIIIPNASGAILTVTLFSVVWYWNDYIHISMLLSNTQTLTTRLTQLQGFLKPLAAQSGMTENPLIYSLQIQAGCLLAIAPLLVMYVVLQKYFTESIDRSGIVG